MAIHLSERMIQYILSYYISKLIADILNINFIEIKILYYINIIYIYKDNFNYGTNLIKKIRPKVLFQMLCTTENISLCKH